MVCVECGTELVQKSRGPRPRYCSAICRRVACTRRATADGRLEKWTAATRERRLVPKVEQTCRFCRAPVFAARRRIRCDRDECRRAAQAARTRPHIQRRRAAKRGAAVVGPLFTSEQIYERDGWRCGLCGGKVRRDLAHPHPESASLDHVIPLSFGPDVGGVHAEYNVQCAHLVCNSRKRAAVLQPALF